MAEITLEIKVNDPHFHFQTRLSHDTCLVQSWWFRPKSVMSCHADKLNFPVILSQNGPNDPPFHYQLRVSHEACLVPIWWFQLKSVTSYHAEKVTFMDGQADGRTDERVDAGNDNTPFGLKGQGEKWCPRDIGNQFSKGSMGS